ncbi:hypothetical protein LTR09_010397 [Extremus antarcticus]|uniref:Uncharacterized protein n=1 Tax=Extremus antarcticus TaxID=702011 RepID=A0AAJ0G8F0_9PEZI|nr:hypothetical protein LTR09_010397 [Extremus antarcticus]
MHISALPLTLLLSTTAAQGWPAHHAGCSENVVALASGIHLNINGQWAEYNGTLKIVDIESASPVNQTDFLIAKGELLSDIQAGMNIRLFNQQMAPPGNAAIPGLAKYAAAQQTEQALAEGLTGVPSEDKKALESLESDIMAGIKLNEKNLKKASQGCDFTLSFPPADESG